MTHPPSHPVEIVELADWTPWVAFTAASVSAAPTTPGVYLFRRSPTALPSATSQIVYVGRASERRGKGIRERLRMYVSGRAPHSGLGNLALERALADPDWLRAKLNRVEAGDPMTVQEWARDAVSWADLELSLVSTRDGRASELLEADTIAALHLYDIWNRRR